MEFKGTKWSLGGISGRMIKTNQYGGFVADVDTKANALLISKAPEMLEILQKLISHYEDVMNSDYSPFALRSDIDNAKELIKQATKL